MPRRGQPTKPELAPDGKYNSVQVAKFINKVMRRGKRSLAKSIVYEALDLVQKRSNRPPLEVFQRAVEMTTPLVEVKPRRVGGATYQVPVEVLPERGTFLAMRWLITSAKVRPGKSMVEKLAAELMDAANGTGASVKQKEDTHRMAEANRAFAHYRW